MRRGDPRAGAAVFLLLALAAAPAGAEDVRDSLPAKAASSYQQLLRAVADRDPSKAVQPLQNLKLLAEHLDKRYGSRMAEKLARAAQAIGPGSDVDKTVASLRRLTLGMIYLSVSLCFDESLDNLEDEDANRQKIRHALEEFAVIEPDMRAQGEEGFQRQIAIRRAITSSPYLFRERQRFSQNADVIRKSLAAAYPEAAAASLRESLRAGVAEPKYRTSAALHFGALAEVLRARDSGRYAIVEKGLRGDEEAVREAVKALEEMFPAVAN